MEQVSKHKAVSTRVGETEREREIRVLVERYRIDIDRKRIREEGKKGLNKC